MFRWFARLVAWVRRLLGLGARSQAFPNPSRSNITSPGTSPNEKTLTNTIRIVGTIGAGKTTYLAALLGKRGDSYPIKNIVPMGSVAEKLIDKAFNVLEGRDYFRPNPLVQQATNVEEIGFRIEIFLPRSRHQEIVTLSLFTKDYSGEFFEDLRLHTDDIVESYLEDCVGSEGLMLLVDGNNVAEDRHLEINLPNFLRRLDQSSGGTGWKGRIAFVISKCEQTKLYLKRQELGDVELARRLFPKAKSALEANRPRYAMVDYFTLSSFGVLGGLAPEPNVKMITNDQGEYKATIRNVRIWQPFGLTAPLYWLCTGERHPDL